MDQFLISRTSDSLNKRSVVETGRGARYLQDCLFLLIRKSSLGLEPPPAFPRPGSPKINRWDYPAASCQVFDPSTDWVGNPCCCSGHWSFDLTILLSMGNVYLPVTKSSKILYFGGGLFSSSRAFPPQAQPGWVCGCWESREQTLVGCRNILVKLPPVSKVSEGITFDFVIQSSWIPMGS